jgi:hypothetical protein
VLSQQDVAVFFNSKRFQIRVIVIKEENVPILGLPNCCELGLVHVPQHKVNKIVAGSNEKASWNTTPVVKPLGGALRW